MVVLFMRIVCLFVFLLVFCAQQAATQQCAVCSAGKYKDVSANTLCTVCPANTYNSFSGGISLDNCTICGSNSQSANTSTSVASCFCNAGFTGVNGACTACDIGKYKTSPGSAACTTCSGYTSTASSGSTSSGACVCNAGYEGASCTACVAGFYKSVTGSGFCTQCPTSKSTPGTAATDVSACECPIGTTGANGVGECTNCIVGTYKSVTGPGICTSCQTHSSSVQGSTSSTACLCVIGYFGLAGQTCTACGAGTYKDTTAPASSCTVCPTSTYYTGTTATSVNACVMCTRNSTSVQGSTLASDCKCTAGFYTAPYVNATVTTCELCLPGTFKLYGAGACSLCPAGKFASTSGGITAEVCLTCTNSTYSLANRSQCQNCPLNAYAPSSSGSITECICNAGYWPQNSPGSAGVSCFACDLGKYKVAVGTGNCSLCTTGKYLDVQGSTDSTACIICPPQATSGDGSTALDQCSCNAGYTGPNGGSCIGCVAGKFKTLIGSVACSNCTAGTYSTAVAKNDSSCTACGFYAMSPSGSVSSSACICSAGYEYI